MLACPPVLRADFRHYFFICTYTSKGGECLSYLHLKEIWTPLKWFHIRIFRDVNTGKWYIKHKNQRIRRLRNII